MERRNAIKNLGLAIGLSVASPTVISLLQSCQTEKAATWTPSFFSPEEGNVLKHLVDILLPKTDTPSASEVNVHIFIDEYADKVIEEQFQGFMRMLMQKFSEKALASSGKASLADLNSEDLLPVLESSLKHAVEEEEANNEAMGKYMEAAAKGEEAELDAEVASANFASTLRQITIWSYKNSEYVGENVLVYQSIPGEYIGCGDLEELTGGRDYSLTF